MSAFASMIGSNKSDNLKITSRVESGEPGFILGERHCQEQFMVSPPFAHFFIYDTVLSPPRVPIPFSENLSNLVICCCVDAFLPLWVQHISAPLHSQLLSM